jgi:hypothetical protein
MMHTRWERVSTIVSILMLHGSVHAPELSSDTPRVSRTPAHDDMWVR